jgi:hypothetical protein
MMQSAVKLSTSIIGCKQDLTHAVELFVAIEMFLPVVLTGLV